MTAGAICGVVATAGQVSAVSCAGDRVGVYEIVTGKRQRERGCWIQSFSF